MPFSAMCARSRRMRRAFSELSLLYQGRIFYAADLYSSLLRLRQGQNDRRPGATAAHPRRGPACTAFLFSQGWPQQRDRCSAAAGHPGLFCAGQRQVFLQMRRRKSRCFCRRSARSSSRQSKLCAAAPPLSSRWMRCWMPVRWVSVRPMSCARCSTPAGANSFSPGGEGRFLLPEADYYTEMTAVKHPYDRGLPPARGIEF